MIDISVVVNAHAEELIIVATLNSVATAIHTCLEFGLRAEVVVVLDKGNKITSEVIDKWCRKYDFARKYVVNFGDLGVARNFGVRCAKGRWIAFVDADDLICKDWLVKASSMAASFTKELILHPEVNVFFGDQTRVFMHIDMDSPEFDISSVLFTNPWTALIFASRKFLRRVPYRKTMIEQQIGYEDWCWAIDAIENGAVHKVVAGTAHAIRVRPNSLVRMTRDKGALTHPPSLFKREIEKRKSHKSPSPL